MLTGSSRRMADIFHELPDADEYADYYEAIPEPECLDNICVSSTRLGIRGYFEAMRMPALSEIVA